MKAINRAIDRFCYNHPKFGIPNLMLYIVVGNAIVYIFSLMDTSSTLGSLLVFEPNRILRGEIWRLISFIIIPPGNSNIIFMAITLYFYYFIGTTLERQWGSGKFTIYYFSGVVLSVIYGFIVWAALGFIYLPGIASMYYVNLTMFFAFATLFPDVRLMLFMIIPIKAKWLGLASALLFVYYIVTGTFPFNLLPLVAIINYFIFCGGYLIDYLRPYVRSGNRSARTINYKKAAKKVTKDIKKKPYTRKCEVCGKTDADYPDLEYRFCSRCEGYHCYCQDHINDHIHFRE